MIKTKILANTGIHSKNLHLKFALKQRTICQIDDHALQTTNLLWGHSVVVAMILTMRILRRVVKLTNIYETWQAFIACSSNSLPAILHPAIKDDRNHHLPPRALLHAFLDISNCWTSTLVFTTRTQHRKLVVRRKSNSRPCMPRLIVVAYISSSSSGSRPTSRWVLGR